jgi:hypothetical protein
LQEELRHLSGVTTKVFFVDSSHSLKHKECQRGKIRITTVMNYNRMFHHLFSALIAVLVSSQYSASAQPEKTISLNDPSTLGKFNVRDAVTLINALSKRQLNLELYGTNDPGFVEFQVTNWSYVATSTIYDISYGLQNFTVIHKDEQSLTLADERSLSDTCSPLNYVVKDFGSTN